MNKYQLGDKVYVYTMDFSKQLAASIVVCGIIKKEDGVYYSTDLQNWIKEEFVHPDRKDAYKSLISRLDGEMNSPENVA